jgi:hypothetical protein
MRKTELDPRILERLIKLTEGEMTEQSIRTTLSNIRREHASLTLNAAAQVFARKRGRSVARWLKPKDRETLKSIEIEKVKIPTTRTRQKKKIIKIASYETGDKLLEKHIDEINKAYTCGCYTATFVLCRKVLENLIVHHILKKKYPRRTKQHREKYFDFNKGRFLDFNRLLANFRSSSNDFIPEQQLVERICQLADGFKETANEMAHSLYHIAKRREIDNKDFQELLDLIARLEKSPSAKTQACAKNSAKCKSSKVKVVARGAGFEPARPKGPQA